jgi:hypothetical protein
MSLGITPAVSMNKLKSRILNPSLTSVYAVLIEKPTGAGFNFPAWDRELLELTCVEASLPGSSIATIETNRDYHGVVERHAYSRLHDETIDFTFMVTQDSNYMQIRFFDYWMKYIVGESGKPDKELASTEFVNRLRYPDDYQCNTMRIVKFEKDLGSGRNKTTNLLVYNFVQAFPKAINTIPVSYEASQVLKCTVSFTYSRYFISSIETQTDGTYVAPNQQNPNSPGNPDVPWGFDYGLNIDKYKSIFGQDYDAKSLFNANNFNQTR